MKNLKSFEEFVNERVDNSMWDTIDDVTKEYKEGWFADEPELEPIWDKQVKMICKDLKGTPKNIVSTQSEGDADFIERVWKYLGAEDLFDSIEVDWKSIDSLMMPDSDAEYAVTQVEGITIVLNDDRDYAGSIISIFVKKSDLKKLDDALTKAGF